VTVTFYNVRSILNGTPSTGSSSNSLAAKWPENTAWAMIFGASALLVRCRD
jgi:hypothetical protein